MLRKVGMAAALAAALVASTQSAAGQTVALREAADASSLQDRAREMNGAYRLEEALVLYRELAYRQEPGNQLPRLALEGIASIHLASGRISEAAATLDRLAGRAERLCYV